MAAMNLPKGGLHPMMLFTLVPALSNGSNVLTLNNTSKLSKDSDSINLSSSPIQRG